MNLPQEVTEWMLDILFRLPAGASNKLYSTEIFLQRSLQHAVATDLQIEDDQIRQRSRKNQAREKQLD